MPIYNFEHVTHLSACQKAAIAEAITEYHATTFKSPRYIVQCRFVDVSKGPLSELFVGGQPRTVSRLFISLRSGTGRTPTQLEDITRKLIAIWDKAVGSSPDVELRCVYVQGILDSAFEGGYMLPMPGMFEKWVKDNAESFKKKADAGDVDFLGLMKEIEERPEFQK